MTDEHFFWRAAKCHDISPNCHGIWNPESSLSLRRSSPSTHNKQQLPPTMARGRHSKRGGGSRFAAQSAEEIEQRNARLEELDEKRSKRREEAAEEEATADAAPEAVGARVASMNIGEGGGETRKQREERQKEEARAAYRKKHEAGLTEEYKRDMEKLAEVKKRREAAAAKAKQEEETAKAQEEDRKKKVAAANVNDDGEKKKKKKEGIPKLSSITIKKMKPNQMKEALKARGLDIQGNKKELQDRLLKYEAER